MSYSFTIGNGVPFREEDEYDGEIEIYEGIRVDDVVLPNAPQFVNDEMTGQSNGRHPSYSGWADFCADAGISHLFYGPRGNRGPLMPEHPGFGVLTEEHYNDIKQALEARKAISTLPAGFDGGYGPGNERYDSTLARLMWLEFWVRWALDNCENPGIQNT